MSKFKRRKKRYEQHLHIMKILHQAEETPLFESIPQINDKEDKSSDYNLCKKLSALHMFNTKVTVRTDNQEDLYPMAKFTITNRGIRTLGECDLVMFNMEKHWKDAIKYSKNQHWCLGIALPSAIILGLGILFGWGYIYLIVLGLFLVATLLVSLENAINYTTSNHDANTSEKQFKTIFDPTSPLMHILGI